MKPFAILLVTLTLVTSSARATRAHVDTLGAPDPYWQRIAGASTGSGQIPADGLAPSRAGTLPRLFEVFVYASGALSVLLVVSLLRSLWRPGGDARGPESRARR